MAKAEWRADSLVTALNPKTSDQQPEPEERLQRTGSACEEGSAEGGAQDVTFLTWRRKDGLPEPSPLPAPSTGDLESRAEMPSDEERLRSELVTLSERQRTIDLALAEAHSRMRHLGDPEQCARAAADEQRLLRELDRLMTRMRAVEGQLLQIRKGNPPTQA